MRRYGFLSLSNNSQTEFNAYACYGKNGFIARARIFIYPSISVDETTDKLLTDKSKNMMTV